MVATLSPHVSLFDITQATTATFNDLYIRLTFLFFIRSGSKRVITHTQDLVGEEGDLLIFPPGSMVTMENRPVLDRNYAAVGVCFSDDLVDRAFGDGADPRLEPAIQVVRAEPDHPFEILSLLQDTLSRSALPEPIRRHRLVEPLLWLRDLGVHLSRSPEETPLSRVRRLIETDLSRDWRASDVAHLLAMSEPTMRRQLARTGQGFSKILLHTRLEHGLTLLQTTNTSISEIALICGFKTPSHFSDAFRKRFCIRPREIRSAET